MSIELIFDWKNVEHVSDIQTSNEKGLHSADRTESEMSHNS